jgi:predicted acylesterase/phospholipase RssA
VFKAFVNNNIKIDIIAGTSIGGVNAAIIAGAKDGSSQSNYWNNSGSSLPRIL